MTVVSAGSEEVVQVERPNVGSANRREEEGELSGRSREDGATRDSPCLISREGWMKVPLDSSQERRDSEDGEAMGGGGWRERGGAGAGAGKERLCELSPDGRHGQPMRVAQYIYILSMRLEG